MSAKSITGQMIRRARLLKYLEEKEQAGTLTPMEAKKLQELRGDGPPNQPAAQPEPPAEQT